MQRLFPSPLMSLWLLLAWLLLNQSASVGHWLLGTALAIAIPWFSERLRPQKPRVRRWGVLLRLMATVLWDICKSNVDVAKRVLGPRSAIRSAFVWVPLTIRDPHGIVMLAGIITMTPGTLSSDLTEDRRHLLVHALHCDDEAALIADIKSRYEAPLIVGLGEGTES
ncbi:MAG: Na+/H+ antiporter subunit E [Rubrivivax sp.]|jgi:multicomponent K+:H+ antiporter subunit E|nr:Na+/H+ antiporter subunit E [Rubrivivax sp.]